MATLRGSFSTDLMSIKVTNGTPSSCSSHPTFSMVFTPAGGVRRWEAGGSCGDEEGWTGEGEKRLRGFHSLSKTPTPLFRKAAQLFLIPPCSQPLPRGWGAEAPGTPGQSLLSRALSPGAKGRGVRVRPAGVPTPLRTSTAGLQAGGKQGGRAGGREPSLNVVWGVPWVGGTRDYEP